MSQVCKNCHNLFDYSRGAISGEFCCYECEREYSDRKDRERIQTIAQVSAAVELKKQTEIMKQQQRQQQAQQQAQIARENAIRQAQYRAELEVACKKYGVSEDIVVSWMKSHEYSSIDEAVQKAKELNDASEKSYKEFKEKVEKREAEFERIDKEHLKSLNSERQEKQKQINDVLLNYKDCNKESWRFLIIPAIFAVVGFIFYFVFRSKIYYVKQYGFWSTLLTFIGVGSFLPNFIFWSNFKKTIKKIARIKGDDQYPSYNLSKITRRDAALNAPIFLNNFADAQLSMSIGIHLFLVIAVFKYFKYVHIPYVGVIARILVILVPFIIFITYGASDKKEKKDRERNNKRGKAYAEKKLGQFIWSL